jgi:nucleolar protein 4
MPTSGLVLPNGASSILQPDVSSSTASRLLLQGRILDVVRAVKRDEAERLREEGERRREVLLGKDKDGRNMVLLREGTGGK